MPRLLCSLFLLGALPGNGIIFAHGSDPPTNKETAPTGAYLNSGWQHLVRFKNFQGTMISPKHFITAAHLGNATSVTQPSYFNGVENKTFTIKNGSHVIITDGPISTDLSIFEIWETFENYAPLYTSTNETGKEFVLTGKGRGQGDVITRSSQTVGWKWGGTATEADRWGVSEILSTTTTSSGADLIYSQFDSSGGPHECQATGNDSGGGWFIKDGSVWKLAAVTFSADSTRDTNDTTGDNSHFRAAMTKARGFYIGSDTGGWTLIPTSSFQYFLPSLYETNDNDERFYDKTHSYGTRISSYLPEINALIQPAITHAALTPTACFAAWLNTHGVTTNTGALDDADADGIANLLEYYADSHPGDFLKATSPFTATQLTNGAMQFTLVESLDLTGRALTGIIQQSSDLDTWTEVTTATESATTLDPTNGTRTRILDLPAASGSELFFRFKVSLAN